MLAFRQIGGFMRLSWNEIRARAARFSEEWKDAHYEKGETQTFYNDFKTGFWSGEAVAEGGEAAVHVEAATLLGFTEQEFAKTLELGESLAIA